MVELFGEDVSATSTPTAETPTSATPRASLAMASTPEPRGKKQTIFLAKFDNKFSFY